MGVGNCGTYDGSDYVISGPNLNLLHRCRKWEDWEAPPPPPPQDLPRFLSWGRLGGTTLALYLTFSLHLIANHVISNFALSNKIEDTAYKKALFGHTLLTFLGTLQNLDPGMWTAFLFF